MLTTETAELPAPAGRLVLFTAVLTDLLVMVDSLPEPGGDVPGRDYREVVGGGFNVIAAAARLGMATAYARELGDDSRAHKACQALLAEGVELLLPEPRDGSSGVCLVMVDASGERTMVTADGVEARLEKCDLERIRLRPDDVIYLSGYDLQGPQGTALVSWLAANPASEVIFDPGPPISDLNKVLVSSVLELTTWLTMNAAEALAMTGCEDLPAAACAAVSSGPRLSGVVVRSGKAGCLLAVPGQPVCEVPAYPARVIDTTGAGDAHVGAFVAALARGLSPRVACQWANASASVAVSRSGRAAAPGLEELMEILRARGREDPTAR